jgi:hypothetical protein
MFGNSAKAWNPINRRHFIGGSDARVIMGSDEPALQHLWREKRGEAEPEDHSGNLVVQLGLATEALNRQWYERTTGQVVKDAQSWVRHPVIRWMAATLDEIVEGNSAVPNTESTPIRRTRSNHFRNLCFDRLRRRTPEPPPFSSMNKTPAPSIAARIFSAVSSRPPSSPSIDSRRATVGSDTPDLLAKSACDQPSRARAALIWRVVTTLRLPVELIEFLLTA